MDSSGNKVFLKILITANLSGFKAFGGHPSKLKHTVIRELYQDGIHLALQGAFQIKANTQGKL